MIHLLTQRFLLYQARKLKVNLKAVTETKEPTYEKTKLTEEELLEMHLPRQNTRSTMKIFKDKYEERKRENEGKEFNNNESNYNKREKKKNVDEFENEQATENYEKRFKSKYKKEMFKDFTTPNETSTEELRPGEASLYELSRVRLEPQYLPKPYLIQTQKVFHKYGQKQLKEIASHFSTVMRLRYTEEKIDYEFYEDLGFKKLELKPEPKKVQEPIYLIGKDKIYEETEEEKVTTRRADDDAIQPEISYTQNIVVSYMLVRSPRTYATAARILKEIKFKYDKFRPTTFIDFGAGLSAGSTAFIDTFNTAKEAYAVEPAPKMRKMSQYLTKESNIQHFTSLGELSTRVRQVDIVYAGYVLNELKSELIEVYLEALWAKVKPQGFLVIVEYGNPFGSRMIHTTRKYFLETKSKNMRIAAPCPHHMKCPLIKGKQWCHFDQPSGMYPKNIFGHLPNDNSVQLEKFSYIIFQNTEKLEESVENVQTTTSSQPVIEPNTSDQWDRILFPLKKRGKHFGISLCTKIGRYESRVIAKSHGEEYKEGRKLRWGDLWRFGKRIPNKFRKERATGRRIW